MQQRQPLLPRFVARLRRLRHELFGREPSAQEWEQRLERIVGDTVAESLRWIPEEGSFLDVGANVGVYAEGVLRARPRAKAWLFEPVRAHFERCRKRFEGRPNVVVENLALGDEPCEATIWKLKHNPGGNTLVHELAERWRQGHENADGKTESPMHFRPEAVQCRVFDDYAREHGIERVDFIKSDTEGFDYRVLRGMLGFLARCDPKPVILAELWRADIFPDYEGQMSVLESLYGLGYARVDLSRMNLAQDFLFVPMGREPIR
ncbi:MAG: FkbM family methyltransferase [Planctomycetota bacterium]